MAKRIVRASERDAIFRQADILDLYNRFGPPEHEPKPKAHPHSDQEQAGAPGAAEWEHDHPGKHLWRKKPEAIKPDFLYTGAAPASNRYVLLPHWDPQACVDILHDHAGDMGSRTAKKWDEPGTKCKYCTSAPTHAILHSEGMAYVQTCDKHLGKGKDAAAACVPYGGSDPSNIDKVKKLAAPQVTPELMDMAKGGGFTLHDHVGDAPSNGYMVSRNKNTEQMQPLAGLKPEHIADYVGKHTRELSSPNSYLGGWLDGKNFYLDVSTHRPTLDRATQDAAMAHQLAIYDLTNGTSINTPDAAMMAGDPGLLRRPVPKNPLTSKHHYPNKWEEFSHDEKELPAYEVTPAHNWLQHSLGDAEHWGDDEAEDEPGPKHLAAGPTEVPQGLKYYQDAEGSTHNAQIYRDPKTQENWLVKHSPPTAQFLADGDVAANHIASISGLETPATFKTDLGKGPASAQYMYPGATDAWKGPPDPEKISDSDLLTVQKHHALDWMIGNHDSHERQFIRGQDGQLIGIDKAQAFKYFNNDRLHWNFHPNAQYNEHEPVYNTLYRNMATGGRKLFDPRDGELGKYVQGLQSIPDKDYVESLRPYAEGAAKAGQLGSFKSNYPGMAKGQRFKPNDVEGFLNAAVARKNSLGQDMGDLYDRAMAHRSTGEKIARVKRAVAPDPAALQSMHEQMGSHGARVYSDPQGQWLIKRPPPGAEFMVPLDRATSELQERVGLKSPETHILPWKDGTNVTAVKMIPGATQAWQQPPRLTETHPNDIATLQKHQALDWLIGNHDGHVGNFMRDAEGDLVGIDKGQAAKYYGRDRLDSQFHPNFYAREPVYNQLWRDHAAGHEGEMADPRIGDLGKFVSRLQDIPDHELKNIFRPYAEAAADAGMLANPQDDPKSGAIDPRRQLGEPTIAPNDPEGFLEAMAQRKNRLAQDLGALYDRASAQRGKAHDLMNRSPKHLGPQPKHMAPDQPYTPQHAKQPQIFQQLPLHPSLKKKKLKFTQQPHYTEPEPEDLEV